MALLAFNLIEEHNQIWSLFKEASVVFSREWVTSKVWNPPNERCSAWNHNAIHLAPCRDDSNVA